MTLIVHLKVATAELVQAEIDIKSRILDLEHLRDHEKRRLEDEINDLRRDKTDTIAHLVSANTGATTDLVRRTGDTYENEISKRITKIRDIEREYYDDEQRCQQFLRDVIKERDNLRRLQSRPSIE